MPNDFTNWDLSPETRDMLNLVIVIALIHFVVEAFIMGTLSGWHLSRPVIAEGLLDSTLLTLLASPPIYLWVVKPFVTSSRAARAALANELELRREQTTKLERTLDELRHLLSQNEDLRWRLQKASANIAEINEQTLQRIGADLHDGPAQLLAYSMLRLNKLATLVEPVAGEKATAELKKMRLATSDALRDVRNICTGLSLPQLKAATLSETIRLAAALHEEHTGTSVQVFADSLPDPVPHSLKICVYRFIQEGLANAYRHAGAMEQTVIGTADDHIDVKVLDKGPGFEENIPDPNGLGLTGMRARIEALGGTLIIESSRGKGTCLTARFPLAALDGKP